MLSKVIVIMMFAVNKQARLVFVGISLTPHLD